MRNINYIIEISNKEQSLKSKKMQFQTGVESRISPTKLLQTTNSSIVLQLEDSKSSENYMNHKKINGSHGNGEFNGCQENNNNNIVESNNDKTSGTSADENSDEVNYSSLNNQNVIIEKDGGLSNKHVLTILALWYLLSALTLFTNKYLVSNGKGDPTLLGAIQMTVTSLCCFIQINLDKIKYKKIFNNNLPASVNNSCNTGYSTNANYLLFLINKLHFWRDMLLVGSLRLFSIILGLMALKQSSISFVETIKSSSPLFTVIISRLLIGEVTGFWTKISLLPIMLGLALCSSFEINFSIFGFLAAILTNITECLQMVFSKLLLCGEKYKYTPLELQFFTSFASCIVLIPVCLYTIDIGKIIDSLTVIKFILYILNSFLYHGQTFLAFTLMSYISPVTYSVTNTLKRALLIWVSVIIFQNQIAYLSAFGTFITICGVLFYNHVRHIEHNRLAKSFKNANN